MKYFAAESHRVTRFRKPELEIYRAKRGDRIGSRTRPRDFARRAHHSMFRPWFRVKVTIPRLRGQSSASWPLD